MTCLSVTRPRFCRNHPFASSPRRSALFRAELLGIAIGGAGLCALPVYAQSAVVADARDWNIPAGPLDAALASYASAAGVSLSFESQLVAGRQSAGVIGEHTAASALAQLLAGTGLEAERGAAGVFRLRRVSSEAAVLPAVKVRAAGALGDELPEAYAGGQVARGGQLGVLGNRDVMDTPFAQSSYTARLMQDQQARTLGDVLKYDSSVREQHGAIGDFKIRGFTAFNSEFLFGGLMGVTPTLVNLMAVETLERIEVLKGPSTVVITSSQYIDPANTQRIDGWERFDLGVRYTTRAFGRNAALRASVENVFNKSYWANAAPALELNVPRTLLLSTTVDF